MLTVILATLKNEPVTMMTITNQCMDKINGTAFGL